MEELLQQLIEGRSLAIIAIILFAYAVRKAGMYFARKVIRRSIKTTKHTSRIDEERREKTLENIIGAALRVVVWVLAGLMILQELGVDVTPLIAGAGVFGVALGFGAQSIVKDSIAGLFIIFENQYRVGDVVMVNSTTSGVVEKITLRATVLRDLDGMVHHIPNGLIELATNMTMEFANVNIDIGVSYDSDVDQVEQVINEVGVQLASDTEWKESIIEAPAFVRVDSFDDSAIIIKILGKTTADQRWAVSGELRRRLKAAFDENGITIPFPQMVVHQPKKIKKKS